MFRVEKKVLGAPRSTVRHLAFLTLGHEQRRRLVKRLFPRRWESWQDWRNKVEGDYSLKPFTDTNSLFIHIPKAAGMSVNDALYGKQTGRHTPAWEYALIYSAQELQGMYKFSFVRNPWDRLLSAYRFLKKGGINRWDREFGEQELSAFDDFNDFVHAWLSPDSVWKYFHFYPQWYFLELPGGRNLADYVGRFETMEDDFQHICAAMGREGVELPAKNVTGKKVSYREIYDEKSRDMVAAAYRKDIEDFCYTF